MMQSSSANSRFRLVRDRWTRRAMAAVAVMAVGSLIARRAAASAGQAAGQAAGTESGDPPEHVSPAAGHALARTITPRLRPAWTAAAGRLSAAGHAAWREFLHPDHGTRSGPDPAAPPGDAGTEGKTDARCDSADTDQTGTP
jgi:hypothetical protein